MYVTAAVLLFVGFVVFGLLSDNKLRDIVRSYRKAKEQDEDKTITIPALAKSFSTKSQIKKAQTQAPENKEKLPDLLSQESDDEEPLPDPFANPTDQPDNKIR